MEPKRNRVLVAVAVGLFAMAAAVWSFTKSGETEPLPQLEAGVNARTGDDPENLPNAPDHP